VNVLLDTHVLLWYYLDDPELSSQARATIQDPANAIFVSAASHWEIAIKVSIKKYTLHIPFATFVQEAIFDNGFRQLPVEPQHSSASIGLPFHHRDPFDRFIIAQAIVESMPIISNDSIIDSYPVKPIW
jgi:PIN domain nuclease of toxin-antitoxin system